MENRSKIIKNIVKLAMIVSIMAIAFIYGSKDALLVAIADNGEVVQLGSTNHEHEYRYEELDKNYHKKTCDCGYIEEEACKFIEVDHEFSKCIFCEHIILNQNIETDIEESDIMLFSETSDTMVICGIEYTIEESVDGGNHNGLVWYIFDATPSDATDNQLALYIGGSNTEGDAYISSTTTYPWSEYKTNIIAVYCDAVLYGDVGGLFYKFENTESFEFGLNFSVSNVTRIVSMFSYCSSLTSLDISGWDISNVNSLGYVFSGCSSLNSLNIANWDTSNIIDTAGMFDGCASLTSLDLSGWDVSKVVYMSRMFAGCSSLTSLDLSTWDTPKVIDMSSMFYNCQSITSLDISNFNMTNVTDNSRMFMNNYKLQELILPETIQTIGEYFIVNPFNLKTIKGCSNIGTINPNAFIILCDFKSGDIFDVEEAYEYLCTKLGETNVMQVIGTEWRDSTFTKTIEDGTEASFLYIDIQSETLRNGYDWEKVFIYPYAKPRFVTICGTDYAISSAIDSGNHNGLVWYVFDTTPEDNTDNALVLYLEGSNTEGPTYISNDFGNIINPWYDYNSYIIAVSCDANLMGLADGLFAELKYATNIEFGPNFDVSQVTGMSQMFYGCTSLSSLDVSTWDTSNVTNMFCMFYECKNLENIDISNFNMTNVTDNSGMFFHNFKLQEIVLPEIIPIICDYFIMGTFNLKTIKGGSSIGSISSNAFIIYFDDSNNLLNIKETYQYLCSKMGETELIQLIGTEWRNNVLTVTIDEETEISFLCIDVQSETLRNGYNWESAFIYPYEKPKTSVIICGKEYEISSAIDGGNHNGLIWYIFDATPDNTTDTVYSLYIEGSNTEGNAYTSNTTNYYYPWDSYKSNIKYIECNARFRGDITSIFEGMWHVSNIHFGTDFHTSYVTSMRKMFKDCQELLSIDVSNFDMSHVTDIGYMFTRCPVTGLDVSSWDISNVDTMEGTFQRCTRITNLDVSKWNTSKITNMAWTFEGCSSLTELDVSKWNTSNVTNMRAMFNQCSKLTTLNVSNWNTSKVTNMGNMFTQTSKLTNIDISNFDVSNVTNMYGMFHQTNMGDNLKGIEHWNVSKVKEFKYIFAYLMSGPSKLDLSKWDVSSATDVTFMFYSMRTKVKITIDVTGWNMPKVTSFCQMFAGQDNLYNKNSITQIIGLETWDTSNITDMSGMFKNAASLQSLDLSTWNTENVTDMSMMFQQCTALQELYIFQNVSNVTNMAYMFQYCVALNNLDLSGWNTNSVTNMNSMFSNCLALQTLNLFQKVGNVTDMSYMFNYCKQLTCLNVSDWDVSKVIDMTGMFCYCIDIQSLDVSKWKTSEVVSLAHMFEECYSLRILDISGFDMCKATDTNGMLKNVITLEELYLPQIINTISSNFLTNSLNLKLIKGGESFCILEENAFYLNVNDNILLDAEETYTLLSDLQKKYCGTEWRSNLKYKTDENGNQKAYIYLDIKSNALRNVYEWEKYYFTFFQPEYVITFPKKVSLEESEDCAMAIGKFNIEVIMPKETYYWCDEMFPFSLNLPESFTVENNNEDMLYTIAANETIEEIMEENVKITVNYIISGPFSEEIEVLEGCFNITVAW